MMRCSVCVKSRPSTRVWKRPSPPNRLSTTKNTRFGSNTNSDVPRNGFTWTRFRLVGIGRLRVNSLYFCTFTGPTEISAERRMKLKMPTRKQTREAVVDDFEAGHPAADDAFLRREVVGAYARDGRVCSASESDFAGDALEEGIDLLLGHELFVAHSYSSCVP